MAKISVRARSGTARLAAAVQAHTIQQAPNVVVATRCPGCDVRATFRSDKGAFRSRILSLEWD
jgi:hypothetical protein